MHLPSLWPACRTGSSVLSVVGPNGPTRNCGNGCRGRHVRSSFQSACACNQSDGSRRRLGHRGSSSTHGEAAQRDDILACTLASKCKSDGVNSLLGQDFWLERLRAHRYQGLARRPDRIFSFSSQTSTVSTGCNRTPPFQYLRRTLPNWQLAEFPSPTRSLTRRCAALRGPAWPRGPSTSDAA